jgi:hypothetical protein
MFLNNLNGFEDFYHGTNMVDQGHPTIPLIIRHTSVACAIGPSLNPLQNTETQHVNIVLQCMYQFFLNSQI